jgi:hypothetical protein
MQNWTGSDCGEGKPLSIPSSKNPGFSEYSSGIRVKSVLVAVRGERNHYPVVDYIAADRSKPSFKHLADVGFDQHDFNRSVAS